MSDKFNLNRIMVLGAGAWGTALAKILACNIDDIFLYTRNSLLAAQINNDNCNHKKLPGVVLPQNIKAIHADSDVKDLNTVVIVSPVKSLDELCSNFKKKHSFDNIVICSKGIDNQSLNLPSQICERHFPHANIAVLSGPNFAMEIASGKVTKTLIATKNQAYALYLQKIFQTNTFYPEISKDVIGVGVCGAIKNVIAIAIGIAKGLDLGQNFAASLLVAALEEIKSIVRILGGEQETVYSLAGLGDMLLTCYSLTSRNTSFGYNLAVQKHRGLDNTTVEGYYTAKSLANIINKHQIDAPICKYVRDVLYGDLNLNEITRIFE
ncbi:NAD(P)H-dependent glycerol-3-phosphate dehydrogenase [Candidatus Bandiella euplotis]|uniref:Glycerol-3-phosphate dehydrogenase [NAD(P)+] n=1 Tax=Candidatus Bandiella euplotis TaxID=1664265 RepID=A0ABZ0UML5_9RICK|nr:NAD(P)H-dependent glycerol-3-phosphate dehydrogenase [Candidatus Bandiella woodruffii]WPX96015.1 NAD(P)-dependendent glycerol-3-phosphate dehydrogenase [Candidatus Bandiella woodruffii]